MTKGKSGMAMGAERESVEAELHASYRDKLQELEEAVTATSAIKATLQAEAASLSSRLQAEQSAGSAVGTCPRAALERLPPAWSWPPWGKGGRGGPRCLQARATQPTTRRRQSLQKLAEDCRRLLSQPQARAVRPSGVQRQRGMRWRASRASVGMRPPPWPRKSGR